MSDWSDATDPVQRRELTEAEKRRRVFNADVARLNPDHNLRLQVALVKRGLRKRVSVNRHAGLDSDFDDMGA